MKILIQFISVLCLTCLSARTTAVDTLYILYTNNTNGALENCYCPDHPLGSLEKRAVFVRSFRSSHPNTILVDAGDFWGLTDRLPLKDSLVTAAYKSMNYDAILPGDQELARNSVEVQSLLKKLDTPIVASNVLNPTLPNTVAYRILKRAGLKIGICGIVSPAAFRYYPKNVRQSIDLKSPELVLGELVPELRETCDIVLVLSHQGFDRDRALAEKNCAIDVIIGAHSQTVMDTLHQTGKTIICQAGKEGYYVGVLELEIMKPGQILRARNRLIPMTLELPNDPYIMGLIHIFEDQTGFINRRKQTLKEN